jgi:hypothetical protein
MPGIGAGLEEVHRNTPLAETKPQGETGQTTTDNLDRLHVPSLAQKKWVKGP